MNIIFSSCGNDSVAVTQWAFDNHLPDLHVAYSDTQWASPNWPTRVNQVKQWVERNGAEFHIIESEGFASLAKRKKAFPSNGMAFCSYELKIKPAMEWLESIDPKREAHCFVGIMRIESRARSNWPVLIESSPNHGGRPLHSPLATRSLTERNALIHKADFEVLSTRSRECSPCVNSTICDLQQLDPSDIHKVHELEVSLGTSERTGKPKYMFRPHRMGGAKGIFEVKQRADQGGGDYSPLQSDLFTCDSGFCGT